jgi:hypothetical protein
MGIVWLASYPKSGNTWVRFLLYSAMFGSPKGSLDIARKIPDIHRPIPFEPSPDGHQLCKTHFAYSPKHPKIADTEKVVLIIRDPRDVFFSALNYRRLSGLTKEQMSDETFAKRFIATMGDPDFKSLGFGSWASHIDSWKHNNTFPICTVKYEDLKADSASALKLIGDFVGYNFDDQTIQNAVKASSFDSMRALEIREKHQQSRQSNAQSLFVGADQSRKSKTYFMNTGKTGQTLASISPAVERAFNKAFAPAMEAHGYTL